MTRLAWLQKWTRIARGFVLQRDDEEFQRATQDTNRIAEELLSAQDKSEFEQARLAETLESSVRRVHEILRKHADIILNTGQALEDNDPSQVR